MNEILIASDHAGFSLKEKIKSYLQKLKVNVGDIGTYSKERCDYPQFAARLAELVSGGKYKRGILICKTGIGNSIIANRFSGVRAALCYNVNAARLSRQHNDSNILVLGAAFVNEKSARRIINVWLNTEFMAGRHSRRLSQIKNIERKIRCNKR